MNEHDTRQSIKDKIIRILEKEIDRHTEEIEKHNKLAELRNSKTQKMKSIKHFHKRFQTILIAKKLDMEFCSECRRLR